MQTEEIIHMAREADIEVAHMNKPMTDIEVKQAWLERFAALVAAHEREACAKVCEEGTGEAIQKAALELLINERKRIAAAVRAKGQ